MKNLKTVLIVILMLIFFSGCAKKEVEEKPTLKMAAIYVGTIQDGDWTTLGYIALQEVGKKYNIETSYSQKVSVADAEQVMKEYIAKGYNIIFADSAEYVNPVDNIADQYPNVSFISYAEEQPKNPKPNIWYINRNYYSGAYVLGALAALTTKTGKIGFIGALDLPFLRGQINAIKQAIKDLGLNTQFDYVFVGSFDDPVKAKQAAESFISKGVDVLINVVNLGIYGIFQAAKEAETSVYVTCMYTDKGDLAPDNFLTADLFNFTPTLDYIVGEIVKGTKGGYTFMEFGENKARYPRFPISNVTDDINNRVKQIADDVASGKIQVTVNMDTINP
ncbi:BMP family ABC transporter substrate-binding protein [bacterium]|nr:BMP family ABC transporter substrate-binding protein [bacterium]